MLGRDVASRTDCRPHPLGGRVPRTPSFLRQETGCPLRPLRLFVAPEPIDVTAEVPDGPPLRLRWRRVLVRVVAANGPERIAPEWWRPSPDMRERDYFRIEPSSTNAAKSSIVMARLPSSGRR